MQTNWLTDHPSLAEYAERYPQCAKRSETSDQFFVCAMKERGGEMALVGIALEKINKELNKPLSEMVWENKKVVFGVVGLYAILAVVDYIFKG